MPQNGGGRGKEQDSFRYEILTHYGILSKSNRGWTRELNLIRWNGRKPKYDLRDWNPDHDKMSKGITLTDEEMMVLMSLIEENQIGFALEEETEAPESLEAIEATGESSSSFESKAAEEKAYAESETSGETGTRDFAGELYEAETA